MSNWASVFIVTMSTFLVYKSVSVSSFVCTLTCGLIYIKFKGPRRGIFVFSLWVKSNFGFLSRLETVNNKTMKETKSSAPKKVACVILSRTDMETLAEFHANKASVNNNDFVHMEAAKVEGKKKTFWIKETISSTNHHHIIKISIWPKTGLITP